MTRNKVEPLDHAQRFDDNADFEIWMAEDSCAPDEEGDAELHAIDEYEQFLLERSVRQTPPPYEGEHDGMFDWLLRKLCELRGLDEVPHPSEVGKLMGSGWAAQAIRAAADAKLALGGDANELADAVATAAVFFGQHHYSLLLQERDQALAMAEKLAAANRLKPKAATLARTRQDWRDNASATWLQHPTWPTHRVAKAIAGPSDELRSVQRAIGPLAPPTSPSFRPQVG